MSVEAQKLAVRRSRYSPGIGRTTASIRLAAHVGILILVANVKAQVVHHVSSIFDDIGALGKVTNCRMAAEVLELGHIVGMGGRRKTRKNTEFGQKDGSGADGKQGTLASGISLLDLRVGSNKGHGLGLGLQDGIVYVAADDDEDVEF